MSNYRLTRLAERDLVKIWEYTVNEWSINQAEKYIDGLLSSFEAIGEGKIKGKFNPTLFKDGAEICMQHTSRHKKCSFEPAVL